MRPAVDDGEQHIVADLRAGVLEDEWDLLIAHTPCTRLTRAGRHWLSGPGEWTEPRKLPNGRTWDDMLEEFELGVELFTAVWNAPVPHIAMENPRMHDLAAAALDFLPRPHFVHPYYFGVPQFKETGWWRKNLPRLRATDLLTPPARGTPEYCRWSAVLNEPDLPGRADSRSLSCAPMMQAAIEQWTAYVAATRKGATL